MVIYDFIFGIIAILLGFIILLSLKSHDEKTPKGLSYFMAKYGGAGLIFYGILYIFYLVYELL